VDDHAVAQLLLLLGVGIMVVTRIELLLLRRLVLIAVRLLLLKEDLLLGPG